MVEKLATLPTGAAPAGTDQTYENGPAVVAVALTVVASPLQIEGLFTVTIGVVFTVTVPEALALEQVVVVLVIITL